MSVLVWLSLIVGIIGPLLFLAVYAASIRNPSLCDPYFIDLSRWMPVTRAADKPLLPTTPSKIWRLGHVVGQLESNSISNETAVTMAAEHLGADAADVDLMHVLNMGEALEQHELRRTAWSKAAGLLSCVNVMWVMSIIGIALTIGPFVNLVFWHLLAYLYILFGTYVLDYVLFVHHLARPFYNLGGYYLCLTILLNAKRYQPHIASYFALIGCALSIPCLYYSLPHVAFDTQEATTITAIDMFAFLTFALAALDRTSAVLGFLSIVALRCAAVASLKPLLTVLGQYDPFDDKAAILNSMASSAIVMALMLAWKCTRFMASSQHLFAPGVSVVGGVALGIQGLTYCSADMTDHGLTFLGYILPNIVFATVCIALLVMGAVVNIAALRCTSTVFLALWVFWKVADILSDDYQIVTAFLASVIALWLSFFLKSHPEYIVSLFTLFRSRATGPATGDAVPLLGA